MYIDKLIYPAVSIMNRLPFKFKIFTVISMLFVLLILPSKAIFLDFFEKDKIYNNQLIGLTYSKHIHKIIKLTQLHRGLINAYLNGNKEYRKSILANESDTNNAILNFIDFDKSHFNLLRQNGNFVEAMSKFEILKLSNLSDSESNIIFDKHSQIVVNYIKTLQDVSKKSSFGRSDSLKVNFIAHLLEDKILLLEENIGKIRGASVGIFERQKITKEQKSNLLSIYSLVHSLQQSILDDNVLQDMSNYLVVQKKMVFAMDKTDKILKIVDKNILLTQNPSYDSTLFFKKATLVLEEQAKLYDLLSQSYALVIKDLKNKMNIEMSLTLFGLFIILLGAFYITIAFYKSVASSLNKLEVASTMIAEGKTDICLKADTNDELGHALLAFNHMSQKLGKNISFLDGYKMAIDETSIVSKTNTKGIITYVNKMFCDISGFEEKELLGMSHNIVRHPDMPKSAFKELWETINSKKIWKGIVKNRTKDGNFYIVDATIIPVLDSDGKVIEYIGVRHDITELERSKDEIKKQKIDLLTGLPNRSQLLDDLKESENPVLLYMNIDDFAGLNDFYGTKTGDEVLTYLADLLRNLQARIKGIDSRLYKLQADEFLFLVEEPKTAEINYEDFMAKIIDYIESETIECDAQSCVSITISGGVALYSDSENNTNLLSLVTMARKVAKSQNKKFLLYDNEMNKDADYRNNIEWINKIKDAIVEDNIVVYFQPIIDNSNGAITKYESLVRMIDGSGKAISPFFFLDIAKKAKLYTKITKIVLDKSFETFSKFPQHDFSVNITVEDIEDEEIVAYIIEKLENFTNPTRVIFEITESEEIKDYSRVNEFTKIIKGYGAKIAIDDFGSGYANFEHILSLKADFIKIDGSLIKNIDTDRDSRIITEAIIAFSKKMGSKTVVEFVHNEAVYESVKKLGADFSQGFYLGEPSPNLVSIKELTSTEA